MSKVLIDRDVVEQALKALAYYEYRRIEWDYKDDQAIDALRAALKQPQVEQEPAIYPEEAFDMGPEAVPYYTHPQNLSCKSTQARLATLWGYVKEQPPRQPLTDQQIHDCFQHRHRDKATERRMITRAIEEAIWKKNS